MAVAMDGYLVTPNGVSLNHFGVNVIHLAWRAELPAKMLEEP